LFSIAQGRIKNLDHTCHRVTSLVFRLIETADQQGRRRRKPRRRTLWSTLMRFLSRERSWSLFSSACIKTKCLHPHTQGRRLEKLRGTTLI
jgi:hypothetical protein